MHPERKTTLGEFWDGVFAAGQAYSALEDTALDGILAEISARAGARPRDAADVGAGTGRLTVALAKRGLTVTAFDVSEVALRALRRAAEDAGLRERVRARWANMNAPELGEELSGSLDVVFSKLSIAFARDRARALARFAGMLRPRGALVVITPVLVDGVAYDADRRGMSVPRGDLERQLRERFGRAFVLSEEGDASWPLVTYLCTDPISPIPPYG